MSSAVIKHTQVQSADTTASKLTSEAKLVGNNSSNLKPCCVCKDEKAARDKCMLFSTSDDAPKECRDFVDKYKRCMASYGFSI